MYLFKYIDLLSTFQVYSREIILYTHIGIYKGMETEKFNKPLKTVLYFYLLHQGPTTGYEIGKQFSEAIKNDIWHVVETKNLQHPTKLYPILAEMEKDWLIVSKEVQHNKKEYVINPFVLFNPGTPFHNALLKALSAPLFAKQPDFEEKMKTFGYPAIENIQEKIEHWKADSRNKVYFFNPYIEAINKAALPPQEFIRRSNHLFTKTGVHDSLWIVLYFRDLLSVLTNPGIHECIGYDNQKKAVTIQKKTKFYKHLEYASSIGGSEVPKLEDKLNKLPIDAYKYIQICKNYSFDNLKIDSFPFGDVSLLEETKKVISLHIEQMIDERSPLRQSIFNSCSN